MTFNSFQITTALELPGVTISQNIGIVSGNIVRSRSIVFSICAGIQSLFGGNITIFTELCEQTRIDACREMINEAKKKGADGIIAMRYEATQIAPGITEVLCYGTAVKLKSNE